MSPDVIALASDHGGVELKALLKDELLKAGHGVLDLGTEGPQSVDYPDFAEAMAEAIRSGSAGRGVLICGTGIGISIAANRYPFIRAALVSDVTTARLARSHNDANVLVLGGRTMGAEVAKDCLKIFLETPFEGGRHAGRVLKMGQART
ncbi:MAG: ribose 5-phosphate isomerase B [Alphaproteobacteria bacterium]|nr:ribose 5-phosphate isomerase B [Alphaproteobacteria bacterium]